MAKLTTLIAMAAAAVGGIYLTSDEGAKARKTLIEKKNALQPVVADLKEQTIEILEGTKKIDSDEVRANVKVLVNEARKILLDLDIDKTIDASKEAIQVASKKIREANEKSENAITKKPTKQKKLKKKQTAQNIIIKKADEK